MIQKKLDRSESDQIDNLFYTSHSGFVFFLHLCFPKCLLQSKTPKKQRKISCRPTSTWLIPNSCIVTSSVLFAYQTQRPAIMYLHDLISTSSQSFTPFLDVFEVGYDSFRRSL